MQLLIDDSGRKGAIERVEVDAGRASVEQCAALFRGPADAGVDDGLLVVADRLQPLPQRRGNGSAAHGGEALQLLDIRDRHNPGDNRQGYSGSPRFLHETEVVLRVE